MSDDSAVPGMAAAGWLVTRALLQELVLSGAMPRDRAIDILDRIVLVLEEASGIPEPGRSTGNDARQHVEALIASLRGIPGVS